jgi:hypothetical protein
VLDTATGVMEWPGAMLRRAVDERARNLESMAGLAIAL